MPSRLALQRRGNTLQRLACCVDADEVLADSPGQHQGRPDQVPDAYARLGPQLQ
jgi:hypothetical protein